MSLADECWTALYAIGSDDGEPITSAALEKLVELGIIQSDDDGPRLTAYGEKCFVVMESGDGQVPELNDLYADEPTANP
jgi:hypothetical protein